MASGNLDQLRILFYEHFCFRFYSSSGQFVLPVQLQVDWHELSESSWNLLEESLDERFSALVGECQSLRSVDNQVCPGSHSAALYKALEEVSFLFSWDRPVLHSPVKKERKSEIKLGNSIFVVTKLPEDSEQLIHFLGSGIVKKKPSGKELLDSFISQKTKSNLSEHGIAVHVLNTGDQKDVETGEVVHLFNRVLKEVGGGVLSIFSMCPMFSNNVTAKIVCLSSFDQMIPSSVVVKSHLAQVGKPSTKVHYSYEQENISIREMVVRVEFVKCEVGLKMMKSKGFLKDTFFMPGQEWSNSLTVWSTKDVDKFGPMLAYLQHSSQCLVFENNDNILAVLFYKTQSTATFCLLNKIDSHFYQKLLNLGNTPTITLPKELDDFLSGKTCQFTPSKKSFKETNPSSFDVSILEDWRIPDILAPQILTNLKTANAHPSSQSSYHKLMMTLRKEYNVSEKGGNKEPNILTRDNLEVGVAEQSYSCIDSTEHLNLDNPPSQPIMTQNECDQDSVSSKSKADSDSFEYAGDASASVESVFTFAGDSPDEEQPNLDTAFVASESNINFFAGISDDSNSSIDLYEPIKGSNETINEYTFDATNEEQDINSYKPLVNRRKYKESTEEIDLMDPLQLTKPENEQCSRHCENKCGKLKSSVSFNCEMRGIKANYENLNRQDRRNQLLDQLSHQDKFGLSTNVFFIKTEPLCVKFFSLVSGVSARVLSSVIEDFQNGIQRYTHGSENTKRMMSPQMLRFVSWTVSFAKLHGEHSPDDKGVIVLPSFLTKTKLYKYYSDMAGKTRLALSTFYQALGSKFGREREDVSLPCIVIPKDSEHCKCTECLSLKKFKRSAKTELQISVADKLLQAHLNVCARERMQVWCLFQRCVDFKYENIGIQFDDMDQVRNN